MFKDNNEKAIQRFKNWTETNYCILDLFSFIKKNDNAENKEKSWLKKILSNQKLRDFFTLNIDETINIIISILTDTQYFGRRKKQDGKKSIKRWSLEILFVILVLIFWLSLFICPDWWQFRK